MQTPDFTRAQVVAVIGAVLAVAVSFGLHISHQQQYAILGLSGLIGTVLVWADVRIRKHRAELEAHKILAAAAAAAPSAPSPAGLPARPVAPPTAMTPTGLPPT